MNNSDFIQTPPEIFQIVEEGIFRSCHLNPSHFSFLLNLQIKTALFLSPENPTKQVLAFLNEQNVQIRHLGIDLWKSSFDTWRPISEEMIKEGLEICLDASYHPVLVLCTNGVHETGALVGCLRRMQGWNLNSVISEYRCYGGSKSRQVIEQFIELFDLDLISIPEKSNLPKWFIE